MSVSSTTMSLSTPTDTGQLFSSDVTSESFPGQLGAGSSEKLKNQFQRLSWL